jgi:hypothetical protein
MCATGHRRASGVFPKKCLTLSLQEGRHITTLRVKHIFPRQNNPCSAQSGAHQFTGHLRKVRPRFDRTDEAGPDPFYRQFIEERASNLSYNPTKKSIFCKCLAWYSSLPQLARSPLDRKRILRHSPPARSGSANCLHTPTITS